MTPEAGAEMSAAEAAALRQPLPGDAAAAAGIDVVALGSGERMLRRRLPLLQRRLGPFAEHLRTSLGRQLRSPCEVKLGGIELVGQAGAQALLGGWAVAARLQWPPLGLAGYIALNHACSFVLIELAYGTGPLEVAQAALPTRLRLTEVERQTLAPWLRGMARELALALLAPGAAEATVQTLGHPMQLEVAADSICAALPYHFSVGEHQLQLTFLLLPEAVAALDEPVAATADVPADAALAAHLGQAAVTVAATLGTCAVDLEELLALKVGALLWLDRTQADPLPVTVEDTVKFFAHPVARHGALGVEIIARVP